MKKIIIIIFMIPALGLASDITVGETSFNKKQGIVSFALSWKNSWMNKKNHDAAWVFVKFIKKNRQYVHGKLNANGHHSIANLGPNASLVLPKDRVGVFIEPSKDYRGDVNWQIDLKIDMANIQSLDEDFMVKVFALEMVYIPRGEFYLGSMNEGAIGYAGFYLADEKGEAKDLYKISSEKDVISVMPKDGHLYYQSNRNPYRGDQAGKVPKEFPKGYDPFYIMKYEISQGFYVDFLNNIPAEFADKLSPHKTKNYYERRGSITFENNYYVAKSKNRPTNYITWDDGAALADWAGLRPMTELEFTKAARGPVKSEVEDFPWGTDNKDGLERKVNLDDELIFNNGILEKNLTDNNRHIYGASYYWVMDLSGSLWEKCITIGDFIGRSYKGTHGDGMISKNGEATNIDWPKGIDERGGYGYRGGGYYTHNTRGGTYYPHSPIAYRPYGSWAGGKRSIAYSQRYVRSASGN